MDVTLSNKQIINVMKVYMKYNPYSCDYTRVYAAKDGYHYNGSRYKSLSEVREAYKSNKATEAFFTGLIVIILSTCIACTGFLILSAINVF